MTALAGRDATRVADAANRLGWESTETSWQALVERDDIDLVDVCTPGDTHAEIAIAALEAGKHVLCEKPLANTVEEAEAMTAAAEKAAAPGVRSMVGFTYRRVPAIALARQLVAEGRLGDHPPRARAVPPGLDRRPGGSRWSWRLEKDKAGSGALGDIGAHIIDLAQHITGDADHRVPGLLETFVSERPLPAEHVGLCRHRRATGTGAVTVDDAACSWRGSAAERSASSRPPASPTAARTPSGSRSTARTAASRSTSRT